MLDKNQSYLFHQMASLKDEYQEQYKENTPYSNSGRWTHAEHQRFIDGLIKYGNSWKKVQKVIKTRSTNQARSHAQKFFINIKKSIGLSKETNFLFDPNNSPPTEEEKIILIQFFGLLQSKYKDNINFTAPQREKLISIISKLPISNKVTDKDKEFWNNMNYNKIKVTVKHNFEEISIKKSKEKKIFNIMKEKEKEKERSRRDSINSCDLFDIKEKSQSQDKKNEIFEVSRNSGKKEEKEDFEYEVKSKNFYNTNSGTGQNQSIFSNMNKIQKLMRIEGIQTTKNNLFLTDFEIDNNFNDCDNTKKVSNNSNKIINNFEPKSIFYFH